MNREEFEKRLYVAYMDEATVYSTKEVIYQSIVSMIVSKEKYMENIEKGWAEIRRKFQVRDGVCLHFTDIKALLNPAYHRRDPKERNLDMEDIFCKDGEVVFDKLHDFYVDICNFIKSAELTIKVTSQRYEKSPMLINKNIAKLSNGYWYPLFRDHLDEMTYYMIKIAYDEYIVETEVKNNAKYYNRTIKLRYDGDFDLSVRKDFRNAFSHSISNGTKRFTADAFKDIFDEVRFIDKTEIGYCTTCPNECAPRLINHAGNEIVDFITIYASRYLGQECMKADIVKFQGKSMEEAEAISNHGLVIEIQGKDEIYPMIEIKPKLFQE